MGVKIRVFCTGGSQEIINKNEATGSNSKLKIKNLEKGKKNLQN